MAIDATTVWEVRTAGNDLNGGGYVDTGTDYSIFDSAELSLTDIASNGTTTITSATGGFTSAMIGNIIQLSSGTNLTAGFYEIKTHVDTNEVTIDRDPDDGTALSGDTVGRVGGALLSPAVACSALASYNKVWIKAGTYTIDSTSDNVANGLLRPGTTSVMEGYQTDRGDLGTKPVLNVVTITGQTIWEGIGSGTTLAARIVNIKIDGNSLTDIIGIDGLAERHFGVHCEALDCAIGFGQGRHVDCLATGCGKGFSNSECYYCTAKDGTVGFNAGAAGAYCYCLAHDNTSDGFGNDSSNQRQISFINCTSEDNGGDGFKATNEGWLLVNCSITSNAGYGLNFGLGDARAGTVINCAFRDNTSGDINNSESSTAIYGKITLSVDPYEDITTDDYEPNTAPTGGALLRGGGVDITEQTSNTDVGAIQHADPAGGGGGGTGKIAGIGGGLAG